MPLLTLKEYKKRRQITEASTERDEAIEAGIFSAEDAILQYIKRDFAAAPVTETRTFHYDSSGVLETDDFANPTSVVLSAPLGGLSRTVPSTAYWIGPREGPTYYWIDFAPSRNLNAGSAYSLGQMGFTQNLDTFIERFGMGGSNGLKYLNVEVTATWGWPVTSPIPPSIVQAATWLVDEFMVPAHGGEELQAQSIANLSFAYQREPRRERPPTLPPRVQQLLDPYTRIVL